MITEQAQVIAIEGEYVLVQTARQSTCQSCSVNKGCGSSAMAKLAGDRFIQLRILNQLNAKVGDTIFVGVHESGLLKGSLIAYLLPLLCMPLFIALGSTISTPLTDSVAIVLAIIGLLLGVICARQLTKRLAKQPGFHPIMISIEQTVKADGQAILAS